MKSSITNYNGQWGLQMHVLFPWKSIIKCQIKDFRIIECKDIIEAFLFVLTAASRWRFSHKMFIFDWFCTPSMRAEWRNGLCMKHRKMYPYLLCTLDICMTNLFWVNASYYIVTYMYVYQNTQSSSALILNSSQMWNWVMRVVKVKTALNFN